MDRLLYEQSIIEENALKAPMRNLFGGYTLPQRPLTTYKNERDEQYQITLRWLYGQNPTKQQKTAFFFRTKHFTADWFRTFRKEAEERAEWAFQEHGKSIKPQAVFWNLVKRSESVT